MKRWVISLLSVIILTGCDGVSELERGMTLRTSLLQNSAAMTVGVLADYPDKNSSFSLDCTFDHLGNMRFTVLEPETIQGISGKVESDQGMLTFDDSVLYFELMSEEKISPICAPWILMKTLRGGYITSACMENDLLRLTVDESYDDNTMTLDIWIDGNNEPVRADILWEGRKIMSAEIANFRIV